MLENDERLVLNKMNNRSVIKKIYIKSYGELCITYNIIYYILYIGEEEAKVHSETIS